MKKIIITVSENAKINVPLSCSECTFEIAMGLDCIMCRRIVMPHEFDYYHSRHTECPIQIIED